LWLETGQGGDCPLEGDAGGIGRPLRIAEAVQGIAPDEIDIGLVERCECARVLLRGRDAGELDIAGRDRVVRLSHGGAESMEQRRRCR
jgi:hypothetical protein